MTGDLERWIRRNEHWRRWHQKWIRELHAPAMFAFDAFENLPVRFSFAERQVEIAPDPIAEERALRNYAAALGSKYRT